MDSDHDPATQPPGLPLTAWLREGLRAGVFLRPRIGVHQPAPAQLLALVLLVSAIEIALARFEVAGPVQFSARNWLAAQWGTGLLLLLVWWTLPAPGGARPGVPRGLAAWFCLWVCAALPVNVASQWIGIAQAQDAFPPLLTANPLFQWALYLLLWLWILGVAIRLAARFQVPRPRQGALALGLFVVFAVSAWQFPDRPWEVDASQAGGEPAQLKLSQDAFETQQAVWHAAVAAVMPERPGVTDVYGIVFAPFADEDVFLRESSMVARVLSERFDAKGRVLHLLNNPATNETYPWATPLNLERAIAAVAARMDRENDLLVVYLASHGASDYKLAAAHGALQIDPVSPGELREWLDKAGIRHRVIAVSACYSGGWIGPLANATTLVMTAADATHTSYGCGRLSELTYFGRAVFEEQLRKTRSLEGAFEAAVPLIRQRELDAGKPDGFSNPQISVGEKIRPLLRALEQRLDALR